MRSSLSLLFLSQIPILQQLQMEEALLRCDSRDFCLINEGSSPALVLGISEKLPLVVNLSQLRKNPIPIIQRYSGGGSVVVDENSLFISFIFSKKHPSLSSPEIALQWAEPLFQESLQIPSFHRIEKDYAIQDRKCVGNAFYFSRDRWVHHCCFLWDYSEELMEYLLLPKRMPNYRKERSHSNFLCKIKDHCPHKERFLERLLENLKQFFTLTTVTKEELEPILAQTHRKSTTLLHALPKLTENLV